MPKNTLEISPSDKLNIININFQRVVLGRAWSIIEKATTHALISSFIFHVGETHSLFQEAASVELLQTHFVLYHTTDFGKEQVKHRFHTALDHLSIKLQII